METVEKRNEKVKNILAVYEAKKTVYPQTFIDAFILIDLITGMDFSYENATAALLSAGWSQNRIDIARATSF